VGNQVSAILDLERNCHRRQDAKKNHSRTRKSVNSDDEYIQREDQDKSLRDPKPQLFSMFSKAIK